MLRRGSLPRQDDRDDRSRVRIKRGARVTTAQRHRTPTQFLFAAERSDDESVRTGTAAPVHVLVRGETGSGKSTLLQALALGAAGHAPTLAAEHPDLFRAVVGRFPVCLALADYAATLDSRPTPPLRDHPRADARADT